MKSLLFVNEIERELSGSYHTFMLHAIFSRHTIPVLS